MKNCMNCGRENADDSLSCPECGHDVFRPASVDKSASAGFGIRVLARIIDAVYALLVGLVASLIGGFVLGILQVLGTLPTGWQAHLHGWSFISIGSAFLGSLLYHTFCEGIHGATVGKLCCGICVISEDGKPSTMRGAFIRSLAYYVDGLFLGLVAYISMEKSPINQRYGDRWGKTAVFRTKEIAPELRRTPALFVLGLLLGTGSRVVVLASGLILRVFC